MAAQPEFPSGYEKTRTVWTTRSGAEVHHLTSRYGGPEMWFCAGCLTKDYVHGQTVQGPAQGHADRCNATQV